MAAGSGAEAAEPGSEDILYAGRGHRCTQKMEREGASQRILKSAKHAPEEQRLEVVLQHADVNTSGGGRRTRGATPALELCTSREYIFAVCRSAE